MADYAKFSEPGQAAELARLLIDRSSVLATVAVMPSGRIVGANATFLSLLGVAGPTAVIGWDFREFLARPRDWRHWERTIAVGQVAVEHVPLRAVDGREVIVSGDVFSLPTEARTEVPLFAALIAAAPVPGAARRAKSHKEAGHPVALPRVRDDPVAGDPARADPARPDYARADNSRADHVPADHAPGDHVQDDLAADAPAADGLAADALAASTAQLRRLPVGTENVLLVADDASRRKAIGDSLMMLGYNIFVSADPVETMRQASSDEFPLVIVDATTSSRVDPGRFAEALKRSGRRSSLLIIGSPELEYLTHHEHVEFLRKPVSLMGLATGVRSVLDRQGAV